MTSDKPRLIRLRNGLWPVAVLTHGRCGCHALRYRYQQIAALKLFKRFIQTVSEFQTNPVFTLSVLPSRERASPWRDPPCPLWLHWENDLQRYTVNPLAVAIFLPEGASVRDRVLVDVQAVRDMKPNTGPPFEGYFRIPPDYVDSPIPATETPIIPESEMPA